MAVLGVNRRATLDYRVLETLEAGLALTGAETKSLRAGRAALAGAYVIIRRGGAWLVNLLIPPYQPSNTPPGYVPDRPRRLLLKRRELATLAGRASAGGLTILPLKLYTRKSRIKLEIGLARRAKREDRRQRLAERETQRRIERGLEG